VESRETPMAGAVTVTFAPETVEPVVSTTVPEMLPVAWPKSNGQAQDTNAPTTNAGKVLRMSIEPPLPRRMREGIQYRLVGLRVSRVATYLLYYER
jgi:hypothetical protein